MIKGVKIRETFQDFLEEHPELKVIQDEYGNITSILFPEKATKTSYTIVYGNILLYYEYEGESIRFPPLVETKKRRYQKM